MLVAHMAGEHAQQRDRARDVQADDAGQARAHGRLAVT